MQTSLQGISKRVLSHRTHRFGNLYGLLNEKNLAECFRKLRKNGAVGVDQVDFNTYGMNLSTNITDLVDRLKRKTYRTKLVKRVYIPKSDGKKRPLGILVLEDKLVQLAVSRILGAIWEPIFLPTSFGFRPKLGAKDAVENLKTGLQFGRFTWVLDADIKGFFDNLNHDWLVKMLKLKINDGALIRLIIKWLKAGILEPDGTVIHPATGAPQGGIISPILANIYLHYVLDLWFEKEIKPRCKGDVKYVRYADDTVMAFQLKTDANGTLSMLKERLAKFGLTLAEDKTKLVQFNRFKGEKNKRFDFLGFEFRWDVNVHGKPQTKLRTSRKKLHRSIQDFSEWIRKNRSVKPRPLIFMIKRKLQGHWNYFNVPCNSDSLLQYHRAVFRLTFKWLNRRSGRKSYTWKGLQELFKQFNIVIPKVKAMKHDNRTVAMRV